MIPHLQSHKPFFTLCWLHSFTKEGVLTMRLILGGLIQTKGWKGTWITEALSLVPFGRNWGWDFKGFCQVFHLGQPIFYNQYPWYSVTVLCWADTSDGGNITSTATLTIPCKVVSPQVLPSIYTLEMCGVRILNVLLVRFQVRAITVLWNVTPCSFVDRYYRIWGRVLLWRASSCRAV